MSRERTKEHIYTNKFKDNIKNNLQVKVVERVAVICKEQINKYLAYWI